MAKTLEILSINQIWKCHAHRNMAALREKYTKTSPMEISWKLALPKMNF